MSKNEYLWSKGLPWFLVPALLEINVYQTNQSVEKAGVAFVKGADERNKFFEKIYNQ